MQIDCIVIFSGGFDSTTLLYYLLNQKRNPAAITFQYGQRHKKEVSFATKHVSVFNLLHKVVDISSLSALWSMSSLINEQIDIPNATNVLPEEQPTTYVPNRNMIFLALAIAWAETLGVNEVYYGAQKHDIYGYWDTTPEFVNHVNALYKLSPSHINIVAPFLNFSKADILRIGLELGVDYSKTWSCYAGEEVACGICPTCVERVKAFETLGISDPIPYR
ncbi:MAG: 7-cyano-7-deazaguanine synthase QueC [Aggregatilineales bacterium]